MTEILTTVIPSMTAVAVALFAAQQGRRRVTALTERVAGGDGARLVKGAIHGTHAGVDYRVRNLGNEHALLSVVCADRGRVRLSRRRWLDRWGARLLPHAAFSTGDARFDDQVQVQTRDPELARRWLADRAVRRGVLAFAKRVPTLHLDGPRLKHPVPLARLTGDDGVGALHERVEKLGALAAPLDALRSLPPAAPRRDGAQILSWVLSVATVLLGLAALLLTLRLERGEATILERLLIGLPLVALPLAALLTTALAWLLAERSAPWRLLAPQASFVFFGALLASPLVLRGILGP